MKKIFAFALTAIAITAFSACSADAPLNITKSNEGPTKSLLEDGIDALGVSTPTSSNSGKKAPDRDITDELVEDECDDWSFESSEDGYNIYYCEDIEDIYMCDEDSCF